MVKSFARVFLADEAATGAFGRRLAPHLAAGDVLLLEGDLGAGKTSLARDLIRSLAGEDTEVPSPTFTLLQIYETEPISISHFDLYRLDQPEDIIELGWHAALEGVTIVEWPSRLGSLKPSNALAITLTFEGDGRVVTVEGDELWITRLGNILNENA